MTLISYSSVLILTLLSNPWNPTFYLTLFLGGRIPLSNRTHTGINKLFHVLIIVINQEWFQYRMITIKIFPMIKTLEKQGILIH